jgi:hypothetical protein
MRLSKTLNAVMESVGYPIILEPWGANYRIVITLGNKGGYMPVDNATGTVSEFVEVYEKAKQVA